MTMKIVNRKGNTLDLIIQRQVPWRWAMDTAASQIKVITTILNTSKLFEKKLVTLKHSTNSFKTHDKLKNLRLELLNSYNARAWPGDPPPSPRSKCSSHC